MLLTYESEALVSRAAGTDIQYVIPRQTMLIELPIAVIKSSKNKDAANAFIRFTKGDAAQALFGESGWRPVNPKIAKRYASKYPARPGIFRSPTSTFGGWRAADKRWFDLKSGLMVGIEKTGRWPLWRLAPSSAAGLAASRRTRERLGSGLSLGFVTAYLSVIVALPIAALVWASTNDGARELLGRDLEPRGRRRAEADAGAGRRSSRSSTPSSGR